MRAVDEYAKRIAVTKFGFPPSLHIPIAARDEEAIALFIGDIIDSIEQPNRQKALLVAIDGNVIPGDNRPIWQVKESAVLHQPKQVWVHVDFSAYRKTYQKFFPEVDLHALVLDHVMNRNVARLKGFHYLRIVPISRGANSSSGCLSEQYGVQYHSTPAQIKLNEENPARIQYADVADMVKMIDVRTGGSFQDGVVNSLYLFDEISEIG